MSWREMISQGRAMRGDSELILGQVLMAANTPVLLRAAMVEGRTDLGLMSSGQVTGLIGDLPSCAELIEAIMAEAGATLDRLEGYAGRDTPPVRYERFSTIGDVGLAAAFAHGEQAAAAAGALERVQQGGEQPGAGGAEGVAERDRAAARVHPGQVGAGLALPGQHDRGERLVDLHQVDVVQGQPGLVQGVGGGGDRGGEHQHGVVAAGGQVPDPGSGLQVDARRTARSEAISRAAAPSEIWLASAAVIRPPSRSGLSPAIFSSVVSGRGPSSLATSL